MNAVNKSVITRSKNSPLWWIHDGVLHRWTQRGCLEINWFCTLLRCAQSFPAIVSKSPLQDLGTNKQQKTLKSIPTPPSSVGGIYCVDVAVHLVPKRQPGFAGEINLGVPTQASRSLAVTAPRRGGRQARLCFCNGRSGPCDGNNPALIWGCSNVLGHVVVVALTCCWGALFTLAAVFAASVERKALEHLNTHGRAVCKKKANITHKMFILDKTFKKSQ